MSRQVVKEMLKHSKECYRIAKTEHWLNFFSYRIQTLEDVLTEIDKHSFFNRLLNSIKKLMNSVKFKLSGNPG